MSRIDDVAELGQAMWLDFIQRSFTNSGALQDLIDRGVSGVTSNPSIFERAITGSSDYDVELERLIKEGRSATDIYETLAFDDVGRAADLLRPVYERSRGKDGYVSIEVSPALAQDTDGTVADAQRIFSALARPNVMIKIPATSAGVPAIGSVIAAGINVNATLIFSLDQYEAVADAYIAGLERRADAGGDVGNIASVASFFISRVDASVDAALDAVGNEALKGKIAVDNARIAYARFVELFGGERWEQLRRLGARVQRPLWASTGTKNPAYPDTLYLDSLIGPDTVNTVPPDTLEAFLDHGQTAVTVGDDIDAARARTSRLGDLGIDLHAITTTLLDNGLAAFAKSFDILLASIVAKCADLSSEA